MSEFNGVTQTTTDVVDFARTLNEAANSNQRVVIEKVDGGSVTWHTENRGSRLVSFLKDIFTGYGGKITGAVDALLKKGVQTDSSDLTRKSVFESVKQLNSQLTGSRGNVVRSFGHEIFVAPKRNDDTEIEVNLAPPVPERTSSLTTRFQSHQPLSLVSVNGRPPTIEEEAEWEVAPKVPEHKQATKLDLDWLKREPTAEEFSRSAW